MDLDELAEALDRGIISPELLSACLRRLHELLSIIDRDKFDRLQTRLSKLGL
jgi:predicted RNA-binding protein associated with RNAse of E/G family